MGKAHNDRGGRPGDQQQPEQSRPATRAFTPTERGASVLVRMNIQISGTRNGEDWPAPGGTVEVPDAEAAQLVANGNAEAVEAEPAKKK